MLERSSIARYLPSPIKHGIPSATLPIDFCQSLTLGNLGYQVFRVWVEYRDKLNAEDIKQCSLALAEARKTGDLAKIDEIVKQMREKQQCK